jgi:phage FluMu gp28-like protein
MILSAFYPYQRRWLCDRSQFKIGLWARQTGKDFTCAAEAVLDCLQRTTHWLIVAAGERQARESLEKVKLWATHFQREMRNSPQAAALQLVANASEIRFGNGSRISALPSKPQTVRGYSANIILTEFAFHDDAEAIWRAVFPSVSNRLRGGLKKLRIITTPNGQGNFFHRLWEDSNGFSKHRVTIQDAAAQGLPVDLSALREGLFDRDAWAQEYECEFLDGSSVLLPYELIDSCESDEATETSTPQFLSTLRGELFAGIDFGRKRDLTVCWLIEKVPSDQFLTREVLVLDGLSTPAQLEFLRPRIARVRRACVDYTGAGVGLGDLLAEEFGSGQSGAKYTHRLAPKNLPTGGRIELCQFTAGLKNELFPTLRAAFERGRILIPKSAAIREDLHGMQKFVSGHGQLSFRASHTADGHSDRCTALALSLRAAENSPPLTCATSIDVPRYRT